MKNGFFYVRQSGFEPETDGLENRCSIQLSYWRPFRDKNTTYPVSVQFPNKNIRNE